MVLSREQSERHVVVPRYARIAFQLVASLAIAAITAGCGPYDRRGSCRDYKPADFCEFDMVYVCEESGAGCDQCSCVARDEAKTMESGRR